LKLKILKKLRTASLNSEFTGSYKKGVVEISELGVKTRFETRVMSPFETIVTSHLVTSI